MRRLAKYIVNYSGFYIIEADSEEAALETDQDDGDVIYGEWENDSAVLKEN